jgi:LCP family protein required for cell wall assembly
MVESAVMDGHWSTDPTQPVEARREDPDYDLQADLESRYRRRRRFRACGCGPVIAGLLIGLILAAYFLIPGRTNILILGIDRAPEGTVLGRSDTMILTTFQPDRPYVGMLSIPRDLWVAIPGRGENRINTAHIFAEGEVPGSGPEAAMAVVEQNFGVDVDYYVRFEFADLEGVVEALGGIPIELERVMGGLQPGSYVLNGEQALAFVRNRAGTDDFFRMEQGQFFLKAVLKHVISPATWPRIPLALFELLTAVDSDVPIWLWPRLVLTLLRVGPSEIDGRIIDRNMAQGFVTSGGAQVLAPNWELINPVLLEIFGQ